MVLGCDPGLTGAIALLTRDGERIVRVWDMPTTTEGKARAISGALLADIAKEAIGLSTVQGERLEAFVERVAARPGQGVASMFSFGQSYGLLLGVLAALEVRALLVTPASWKSQAKLTGKEKDAGRALALKLWPESSDLFARVKDIGRADAALIAYYGRLL